MLEAALAYARLGYRVFPCVPNDKPPLTRRGFHAATVDADQIRRWWTKTPDANIGLPTEGFVVIDVDGADNAWLVDSPERLESLASAMMAVTPRGGRHIWFRQPQRRAWSSTRAKIAPNVDTRANGGYVVAPPSRIGDASYAWAEDRALCDPDALLEPPAWLIEVLDGLEAAKNAPRAPLAAPSQIEASADVELRALNYIEAMPPAISGQGGHDATYAAAVALVHGFALSPARALEFLEAHYNARCEPPWTTRELEHKVAEAVAKPHDRPYGWLRDAGRPAPYPWSAPRAADDVDLSGSSRRFL